MRDIHGRAPRAKMTSRSKEIGFSIDGVGYGQQIINQWWLDVNSMNLDIFLSGVVLNLVNSYH